MIQKIKIKYSVFMLHILAKKLSVVNLINSVMPKISLWNPVKRNDYRFVDRIVAENIFAGGTGVNVHKYLVSMSGTNDFTQPQTKLSIR